MKFEELKANMSVLEQVLAKTAATVEIDTKVSETAQTKILKKYRRALLQCLILAIVFGCLWIGNVNPVKLPNMLKAFITILCGMAAIWYGVLYNMMKSIRISTMTPSEIISRTTRMKLLTLTGEICLDMALTVFFTLFLSEMLTTNTLAFWLTIVLLVIVLVFSILYFWPRYVRLFSELTSIK